MNVIFVYPKIIFTIYYNFISLLRIHVKHFGLEACTMYKPIYTLCLKPKT